MAQRFNYGGQAVLEGVMMRGSHRMAVAVRSPDKKIVLYEESIDSPLYSGALSRIPFVRGLGMLWDSLGLGTKALQFSAKVMAQVDPASPDAAGDGKKSKGSGISTSTLIISLTSMLRLVVVTPLLVAAGPESTGSDKPAGGRKPAGADIAMAGTMLLSLAFAIGLFFVTPLLIADGLRSLASGLAAANPSLAWLASPLTRNLVEGVIRLAIVIGYIWAIGRIPDIQRLFAYHGAEHKTINAYEAGAALTPDEVAPYSLVHPRCGTGFLLVVMVVSILFFSLLGNPPVILRYLERIVLVPVIATVSYEYIRLTARHMDKAWVRALVSPQLALQKLTTREPSPDMLEVSIMALQHVLASEELPIPVASAVPADSR